MTNIRDLPDKWRKGEERSGDNTYRRDGIDCATELKAALPVWTRITDDPNTWPDPYDEILLQYVAYIGKKRHLKSIRFCDDALSINDYIGNYWRPLHDLDYPTETDDDNDMS